MTCDRARFFARVLTLTALGSTAALAQIPTALPATVVGIAPPVSDADYPTIDYGRSKFTSDDRSGTTRWRVVMNTGNCCENYVTISQGGRLFDLGGSFINFSDDRGVTWKSVQPPVPLVNGEGAIVMAHNGDVLAVEWDPYSGDHLLAFKYEAATQRWLYHEMPLHTPVYDREWISVVPGPFTIDGRVAPYIVFVKGGTGSKEAWLYSTDGLVYTEVSSKFVDQTLGTPRDGTLATAAGAALDWIQANTNGGMTTLGGGALLAAPDYPAAGWATFDGSTKKWTGFRFPGGAKPEGLFQVDSAGRIHNVIPQGGAFLYRTSVDGGANWLSSKVLLPEKHSIEQIDFRANKAAGVAAVMMRTHASGGFDRDLLYKLDITGKLARLTRMYEVGLGDLDSTAGVGNDLRMDFQTVAVFADGRAAVSFLDSATGGQPALAIEGDTTLGGPTGGPPPATEPIGTAQSPITSSVVVPAGGPVRAGGVTSVYVEFVVPAGVDDASMKVQATPSLPADIDLYFQMQKPDGTWSEDISSGTSSDLGGEQFQTGRLAPGRYRVEVHEWVGPPANSVLLKITFYNGAGVAGP